MKVFASAKKTITSYTIAGLVMATIFYLMFGSYKWPPTGRDILIVSIPLVIALITMILGIKMNWYEIGKKALTHHKGNKVLVYYYSEILYIDHEYSQKHKILLFYTSKGHERYLPMDAEMEIYKAVTTKCQHLISKEEYQIRFPKVKL
ncbi:MAG: hypothetical protein ACOX3K_04250 [Bacilli bacterium]|jgi:hypothetical protein